MIKVLSMPGCSKCMMLMNKLKAKGIDFEYSEDEENTMNVGRANSIMSAPIIEVDGKFLDMHKFVAEYSDLLK